MNINDINLENIEEYISIKNIKDIKLTTDKYVFCRNEAREKQENEGLQNTHFNPSTHYGTDESGFKVYNNECIERFKNEIMAKIQFLRREKRKNPKNLSHGVIKSTLSSDVDVDVGNLLNLPADNIQQTKDTGNNTNNLPNQHSRNDDNSEYEYVEINLMKNRLYLYIIITIFFIILFSILYSNSFDIDKDNKKIMTTYSYIYLTILILSIISFLVVLLGLIFHNL